MVAKRFISLRSKVLLFSIVLTVLPIIIVSGFMYYESAKVIRSQVIAMNLTNAKQISETLHFIMNDVNTVSLNLIQNQTIASYLNTEDARKRELLSKLLALLNEQMFNKPYMFSIYLEDLSGDGVDNRGAINVVTEAMSKKTKALAGKESWYYDTLNVQNKPVKVISMVRQLRDMNQISRQTGLVKINILESSIRSLYKTKLQPGSLFYLLDENGVILSALNDEDIGTELDSGQFKLASKRNNEGYYNTNVGGESYLAIYYRLEDWDWEIVELTPNAWIAKPGNVIKWVTVYSILIGLLICGVFIALFASRVLKPLKQIKGLMKQVERENFNLEMKVTGNDEIASLARSFNQMSHRLNELINEVHVSNIKQKEAELKVLEEQINPHFLYNTLDLIYWMSRMEQAFETSTMINSLSQLFRIGLNRGSRYTTVAKEVEHIRHYIQIQQKRYEETITFTIEVADDTLACPVTKMVLQPIVENAIRHGIEAQGGNGRVAIVIDHEGDELIYRVSDDGAGTDETIIQARLRDAVSEETGLGLRNIHDRIRLNYGSRFGVEFHSELHRGTTVTVRQPYEKGMAQDA
ncbi:sensor histidine kinase [Paenibacillus sp. MMO-177]|uniref:sensor histidine kinase n=1 Tax=Paenibacillus sp. MMO-177 TaxID=3081289 RepID=UPI00301AFDEC